VSADLSFITLISEASLLVKLVMLLLLSASVLSWFVIVRKYKLLKQATQAALKFEDEFWSGGDLSDLYTSLYRRRIEREGMEKVFETGFSEYARSYKSTKDQAFLMASIQRSMKVALSREEDKLESNLSLLATIGSTSPYIGLFGTVWGIMNSFIALGAVQNASLTMALPPSETEGLIDSMGRVGFPCSCSTWFRAAAKSGAVSARVPSRSKKTDEIMIYYQLDHWSVHQPVH